MSKSELERQTETAERSVPARSLSTHSISDAIVRLFGSLSVDASEVLTSDVVGNSDLMKVLDVFSKTAGEFNRLHTLYKTTRTFQRKISKLRDSIENAEKGFLAVKEQLIAVGNIKVSLSSGLNLANMARA